MKTFSIDRYDDVFGTWEHARATPDVRLRGLVVRYQGYTEIASGFQARRELPTGTVVLVLSFTGRVHIRWPDRSKQDQSVGSMVTGLGQSYATTRLDPGWSGMQVDLTPLGAFNFLGSVQDLAGRVVDLEDVLGPEGEVLLDRLQSTPGWAERFDRLDRVFLARLAGGPHSSSAVAAAYRRLVATRGAIPIPTLPHEPPGTSGRAPSPGRSRGRA